jgi:hypothetical protein
MARTKTIKKKSLMLEWLQGERNQFNGGEVCKLKGKDSPDRIIVGPPAHELDTWTCKVWKGPKPWDFHWADIHADLLEVLPNEKNPTNYTASDRYPGPSSGMIKMLQSKFAEIAKERSRTRTSKDIDRELGIIEEERANKADNLKEDKEIIAIEDMDDDTELVSEFIDPVQKKRDATIEEE